MNELVLGSDGVQCVRIRYIDGNGVEIGPSLVDDIAESNDRACGVGTVLSAFEVTVTNVLRYVSPAILGSCIYGIPQHSDALLFLPKFRKRDAVLYQDGKIVRLG